MPKQKIIRACTVPQSLGFVSGMLSDLQKKYEVILLSSSGPEWEKVHKSHPDIKCIEVNMERHISPVKDIKSLWRLWHTFRREKPQMVHSMTPQQEPDVYYCFPCSTSQKPLPIHLCPYPLQDVPLQ